MCNLPPVVVSIDPPPLPSLKRLLSVPSPLSFLCFNTNHLKSVVLKEGRDYWVAIVCFLFTSRRLHRHRTTRRSTSSLSPKFARLFGLAKLTSIRIFLSSPEWTVRGFSSSRTPFTFPFTSRGIFICRPGQAHFSRTRVSRKDPFSLSFSESAWALLYFFIFDSILHFPPSP